MSRRPTRLVVFHADGSIAFDRQITGDSTDPITAQFVDADGVLVCGVTLDDDDDVVAMLGPEGDE